MAMTPPRTASSDAYDLQESPLFNLTTKKQLAKLLGIPLGQVVRLSKNDKDDNYDVFTANLKPLLEHELFKKNPREVQKPKPELVKVHKRLLRLFRRIKTPPYLHSAVKGKSYSTNAMTHVGNVETLKVDIKSFYKCVSSSRVYSFFFNTMQCSCDVSYILTSLCCYGTFIPTGSCLSPILSFFVNKKMYDSLHAYASGQSMTMTVYVDDIVFSGNIIKKSHSSVINYIISSNGYTPHKQKKFGRMTPRVVTGLTILNGKLDIPYRRKAKVRVLLAAIISEQSLVKRTELCLSLRGMLCELKRFSPKFASLVAVKIKQICES